jgi:hypothetical protein
MPVRNTEKVHDGARREFVGCSKELETADARKVAGHMRRRLRMRTLTVGRNDEGHIGACERGARNETSGPATLVVGMRRDHDQMREFSEVDLS